jgi:hypothetical protein
VAGNLGAPVALLVRSPDPQIPRSRLHDTGFTTPAGRGRGIEELTPSGRGALRFNSSRVPLWVESGANQATAYRWTYNCSPDRPHREHHTPQHLVVAIVDTTTSCGIAPRSELQSIALIRSTVAAPRSTRSTVWPGRYHPWPRDKARGCSGGGHFHPRAVTSPYLPPPLRRRGGRRPTPAPSAPSAPLLATRRTHSHNA